MKLRDAIKFSKDVVYNHCPLLEILCNAYAADVMYYKNCLSNYLRKFDPPVSTVENSKFHNLFLDFVKAINFRSHAYSLSDYRQLFNEILEKEKVKGDFQGRM